MVFYTCSGCGESLKKNKVDNHAYSCRYCEYVTCMDCSKDFYGNDYKSHTSCITEDQKYAAKGTEFKPNKGDVKQQEWCKQIENALATNNSISQKVRDLLTRLASYDNVPRKQSKFLNFVKNSLRVHDGKLCEEAWEVFQSAKSGSVAAAHKNGQDDKVVQSDVKNGTENDTNNNKTKKDVVLDESAVKTKKKKKEKSDKNTSVANSIDDSEVRKKKKDIEKPQDENEKLESCHVNSEEQIQIDNKKLKKKKRKKDNVPDDCSTRKKKRKKEAV